MKKMRKVLCFLLSLIVFFSINTMSISASSVYGNTNSNLKNGGTSLKYRSHYYTVSSSPNYKYTYDAYDGDMPAWVLNSYSIYKINNDGNRVKTIAKNALSTPYINARSGYIYYIGMSTISGKPGVYKVKTDGTNLKKLSTINTVSYRGSPTVCLPMKIIDNYIYYCSEPNTLNKMSITGNYKKTIYKSYSSWIDSFSISRNYIYINNITNTSHFADGRYTICRVSTSGNNKRYIYNSSKSIYNVLYYKGYIFYNKSGTGLYRMNTDGSNEKCIVPSNSDLYYCIYKDKIYYTLNRDAYDEEENTYLRTCDLNGNYKKTLFYDSHFNINAITGSRVFCSTPTSYLTYNLY